MVPSLFRSDVPQWKHRVAPVSLRGAGVGSRLLRSFFNVSKVRACFLASAPGLRSFAYSFLHCLHQLSFLSFVLGWLENASNSLATLHRAHSFMGKSLLW